MFFGCLTKFLISIYLQNIYWENIESTIDKIL